MHARYGSKLSEDNQKGHGNNSGESHLKPVQRHTHSPEYLCPAVATHSDFWLDVHTTIFATAAPRTWSESLQHPP